MIENKLKMPKSRRKLKEHLKEWTAHIKLDKRLLDQLWILQPKPKAILLKPLALLVLLRLWITESLKTRKRRKHKLPRTQLRRKLKTKPLENWSRLNSMPRTFNLLLTKWLIQKKKKPLWSNKLKNKQKKLNNSEKKLLKTLKTNKKTHAKKMQCVLKLQKKQRMNLKLRQPDRKKSPKINKMQMN